MRFVRWTLRVLAVASVVQHGGLAKTEDRLPRSASAARAPAISDLLECLADRSSASGADRGPAGCYDVFLSYWNHVEEPDDDAVKERKKKRNKQMMTTALLIGAGAKLILLLPMLAVLIGKAVSLSFTSLLITALVFLYKPRAADSAGRRRRRSVYGRTSPPPNDRVMWHSPVDRF